MEGGLKTPTQFTLPCAHELGLRSASVNCELHGWQSGWVLGDRPPFCVSCTEQRLHEQRVKELERLRRPQLLSIARIPNSFALCSFNNFLERSIKHKEIRRAAIEYAQGWEKRRQDGGGVLMAGTPGNGKTHLAIAMIRHIIQFHQNYARYSTAQDFIADISSVYGNAQGLTEAAQVASWVRPSLLVLDEIERIQGTRHDRNLIFHLLRERRQRCKPTVVISNLSLEDLEAVLDKATMERIMDGSLVLLMQMESERRPAHIVGEWINGSL